MKQFTMIKTLLFTFCLTIGVVHAQSVRFKHEFQFAGQNYSNFEGEIHEMPGGGYLTTSTRGMWPDSQIVLLRLNAWGNIVWSKNYVMPFALGISQLIKHSDNEYSIFLGGAVIRIDSIGNVLWSREINPSFTYCAGAKNGALVFEGQSYESTTVQNITAGKMDANGNMLWTTAVDSLVTNGIHGIIAQPLSNGGEQYIMLGTTYWEYGSREVMTCISENGTLLWNKLTLYFVSMDMAIGPDSSLYVTGGSAYSTGTTGIMVLRINELGQYVSTHTLGPIEVSWCEISIKGDSLLLTGSYLDPNDQGKLYNICVDTSLNIIWQRKVGAGNNNYLGYRHDAVLTADGGYAQVTTRLSTTTGFYQLFIIKGDQAGNGLCFESNFNLSDTIFTWNEIQDSVVRPYSVVVTALNPGYDTTDITRTVLCSTVGLTENEKYSRIEINPNPASGSFRIVAANNSGLMKVVVINTLGQSVLTITDYAGGESISCAELSTGCYFIVVNGEQYSSPLIIMQ